MGFDESLDELMLAKRLRVIEERDATRAVLRKMLGEFIVAPYHYPAYGDDEGYAREVAKRKAIRDEARAVLGGRS